MKKRGFGLAAAVVLFSTTLLGSTGPASAAPPAVADGGLALVRLQLPTEEMAQHLIDSGADVTARPTSADGRVLIDLVVSDRQLGDLLGQGAEIVQVIQTESDGAARYEASVRDAAARTGAGQRAAADTLHFLTSYWWTENGQTFLQTQVTTTAVFDQNVEITVNWRTADGTTGSYPLQRFEDAGEYQYHVAQPQPLPAKPVSLTATSSLGGTSRAVTPTLWPGPTPPAPPAGYQKDFIDAYMTPVDIKTRLGRLARQYPDLVDLVDLPHKTQGYRRTATAYVGDPATAAIVVESVKFGDQGANGWKDRKSVV
jgi:hypothetical protein